MTALERFFTLSHPERKNLLQEAICREHTNHFERNAAYRRTVSGRGIGAHLEKPEEVRLLRPAALTFKEYIERMGPFPQDHPSEFLAWLQDQVSIALPNLPEGALKNHYPSLEALLRAIERLYVGLGIEIVTSSGTSGLASFVLRDRPTVELAVSAFFTGIQRSWKIVRGMALIFMMPRETRVAMARVARLGTHTLGWGDESPIYYTVPFAASPDQIRVRSGRLYRPGWEGWLEARIINPSMGRLYDQLAIPRILKLTLECLHECLRTGRPVLLLGGMSQLHLLARELMKRGPLRLPAGSQVATGGGMKERYPFTPDEIRRDLRDTFQGVHVRDVYGMAEANWAAFECPAGNYHIPPWIYAVVTDQNDHIRTGPDTTGTLAFFDPIGGGCLVPPFFQTADMVRLVNGSSAYEPDLVCPCGEELPYIAGRIQRVDLVEEAGCAGQV